MKIIAVMNQKGGIGKTMTAASIAYILGQEQEKKVLVIDADQQGNISMLYGAYDPEGRGLPDLLENHEREGGTYTTSELIKTTPYDRIDIIPCNGYLMNTNMYLMKTEEGNQILLRRRSSCLRLLCHRLWSDYGHDSDECTGGSRSRDRTGETRGIRN